MPKIKVLLTASSATAAVSWGLTAASLWADPLQGNGRTVLVAVTVTSTIALLLTLRERHTDARLRQIEEECRRREEALRAEYRRREAVIMQTYRLIAGTPPTGPQPVLRAVAGGDGR